MAGPDKIMVIRHAEKAISDSPAGVCEDGSIDKHSLTVRGWQRAGALVPFFTQPSRPGIATPATIFASGTSDTGLLPEDEAKSLRPQETVAPTAAKLGLDVVASIAVGDEPSLIEKLRASSGIVLVAWEHKHIPIIAGGFTADPPKWGDRFDAVWVLDRRDDSYALTIVNQDLLAGDATDQAS